MEQKRICWAMLVLLVGSVTISSFAENKEALKRTERIPRPPKGTYILDLANIIDPLNEAEINEILVTLEEEKAVPLYVVILPSLREAGYLNSKVERVAEDLMEAWEISPETLDGKPWDRGVLFLVNREEDSFAFRVETGKGWGKNLDKPALDVIQRSILPFFKKKQFSKGLSRGIRSFEAAIRMQTATRENPPNLSTPGEKEFYLDSGNLFSPALKHRVNKACRELYEDYSVPMFIVTVPSVESVSRKGLNPDTLIQRFYRFWPLKPETRREAFQDHGVMLFFSNKDNYLSVKVEGKWGDVDAPKRLQKKLFEILIAASKEKNIPQGIQDSIEAVRKAAVDTSFPKIKSPAAKTPPVAPAAKTK
jgi:uncharacterized membrane protein YgcG